MDFLPGFYGCPFINAVAEFETGDNSVRAAAEKHKAHLITWLTAQAIELKLPDAKETARSFAVLIDGPSSPRSTPAILASRRPPAPWPKSI